MKLSEDGCNMLVLSLFIDETGHQNMCLCVVKTACSIECCPLEINTISMDTINRLPSFHQLYNSFSAHIFEFYFCDVLILCFLD